MRQPHLKVEYKMKQHFLEKSLGWLLALILSTQMGVALPRQQNDSTGGSQSQAPGLETRPPAASGQNGSAGETPNASGQPEAGVQPVGAAAAPYVKPSGFTASRPAGAVIAPAKQRRMHSIFIKVGIVVGAGAAIAAVALLSHASSSRP
jgi:hypothetical protein